MLLLTAGFALSLGPHAIGIAILSSQGNQPSDIRKLIVDELKSQQCPRVKQSPSLCKNSKAKVPLFTQNIIASTTHHMRDFVIRAFQFLVQMQDIGLTLWFLLMGAGLHVQQGWNHASTWLLPQTCESLWTYCPRSTTSQEEVEVENISFPEGNTQEPLNSSHPSLTQGWDSWVNRL